MTERRIQTRGREETARSLQGHLSLVVMDNLTAVTWLMPERPCGSP